jgi:hypothetical protein
MERSEEYVRNGSPSSCMTRCPPRSRPLPAWHARDGRAICVRVRSTSARSHGATGHARHRGDRVVHRAGDALTGDLGVECHEIVIAAQLVHHFSEEQNRELAGRVARALRPGGIYAIIDAFRPARANDAGQIGALMEFYFALTSQSGTWTPQEMASWQSAAGLRPRRPVHFRTAPGLASFETGDAWRGGSIRMRVECVATARGGA